MLTDGAGGFNLVHQALPPVNDKVACEEFAKKYEKIILSRARQEEDKMAFKEAKKSKKNKKKTEEIRDFLD